MDDSLIDGKPTERRWIGLVTVAVVAVVVIVFLAAHLGGSSVKRGADVRRTVPVDPAVSLSPERGSPPSSGAVTPPSTAPLPSTTSSSTVQVPTTVFSPSLNTPASSPTTIPTTVTMPTTPEPLDGPTCPPQGLFPGATTSSTNSGPIVPSGAQSAIVCEYSWNAVALHVTSTLVQSSSILTGGTLASLIDEVDASGPEYGSAPSSTTTTTSLVSTGVGSSVAVDTPEYELFFSYPAGGVVAFGVSPIDPILSQLASTPTDTEGALWVPSPGLMTEVSSYFN